MTDLSTPELVMARLREIEDDLAERQNEYENAAMNWFRVKRDEKKARAEAFLSARGTVAERSAIADRDTAHLGGEEEGRYEALKAVVRVLDARASIGQSILKAQGRG
jgi:hypothetical protein